MSRSRRVKYFRMSATPFGPYTQGMRVLPSSGFSCALCMRRMGLKVPNSIQRA